MLADITREVDLARARATGYAWGRQDQGDTGDTSSSLVFADTYAEYTKAFRSEQVSFLPNIRDAYETWKRTGAIVEP